MKLAIELAKKSAELQEVPVGAVIVDANGIVIGEGYNLKESKHSALAHAELSAIEQACQNLGNWRLHGCTLYVTLEPCPMCSGAIWASQLERVVFGAYDAKTGYSESLYKLGEDQRLNHHFETIGGLLEKDSRDLLQGFFKRLREQKKNELVHRID